MIADSALQKCFWDGKARLQKVHLGWRGIFADLLCVIRWQNCFAEACLEKNLPIITFADSKQIPNAHFLNKQFLIHMQFYVMSLYTLD